MDEKGARSTSHHVRHIETINARKQVQPAVHTLYKGGIKMDLERIVSILIRLLEDQENAKISYRIIPPDGEKERKKETA